MGGIKMDGQYVFEEIKQKYEKSNKYMLQNILKIKQEMRVMLKIGGIINDR